MWLWLNLCPNSDENEGELFMTFPLDFHNKSALEWSVTQPWSRFTVSKRFWVFKEFVEYNIKPSILSVWKWRSNFISFFDSSTLIIFLI